MDKKKRKRRPLTAEEKEDARRLREVWEQKKGALGLTQEKAGVDLDMTQGAVGQYLNGRIALNTETLLGFSALLGVRPVEISPNFRYDQIVSLEPGPDIGVLREIPVVGAAQLGPEGYWQELQYPAGSGDGVVDIPSRDPNAYALRVRGDSMAPAIRDGWVVVCEPNRALVPGEYVMVCTNDGQCMVKELLFERDGTLHLMSVAAGFGRMALPSDQIDKAHYVGFILPPSKVRL